MSTTSSATKTNLLAGAAALIVMVVAFVVFSGTTNDVDATASDATGVITSQHTPDADSAASEAGQEQATTIVAEAVDTVAQFSDLPTITIDELPIEAIETLLLIDSGGPFPYRQDDSTFQNREGILPDRSSEHYREYTVDTPGSPDRGARRIVSGGDGERYYTDDHYDSFREIIG